MSTPRGVGGLAVTYVIDHFHAAWIALAPPDGKQEPGDLETVGSRAADRIGELARLGAIYRSAREVIRD